MKSLPITTPFAPFLLPAAFLLVVGCVTPEPPGRVVTRTEAVIDVYHGQEIQDPYRWLEDDLSAETASWVKAQNEVTFHYLDSLDGRDAIRERLTELWDYEKIGTPWEEGGRWFWSKNDGLQSQSVIWTGSGPFENPRVLLDPNLLAADGTRALNGMSISPDGKWLVYGVSDGGSDWKKWHRLEIETGVQSTEVLEHIKFGGVTWMPDSSGFFYTRFPAPEGSALSAANSNNSVYFHALGESQDQDRLVWATPDHPTWSFGTQVSVDDQWLILSGYEGTARKNRTWVLPIGDDLSQARPLFQEFDAQYTYVCNLGSRFLFRTTKDAPRGKVIAVDITQENLKVWDEVIPQSEDVLKSVSYLGGKLVCNYLHNAHSQSKIHSTSGVLEHEIQFPGLGVASGISGKHDREEGWYSFSSFTTPGEIYSVDLTTGTSSLRHRPSVDFNPSDFVATQVWYSSKDGTSVPMFLVRKKEVTPNGDLPVLLYGYGGFNIPLTPSFNVSTLVWLEMGGVYAMPNLRGGGEFGAEWHQAGTIHEKQNVFDDFIAAAEWLIDNNWTNSDRLAIRGGSNGGLLVGACMTQRPELFAACLPAVGVLDMLRYHLFTIGRAWASDYGTSEDPEQFKTLLAYSPYHNLEEGTAYPATLVTTGDHDDRVVPAHSFKFAAALQAAHQGEAPVLIRIETRGGHGAGKPTAMRIAEYADLWAFLSKHLGM